MPGIALHILSQIFTKSCKGWSMSPTLQVRKPRLQKATGCRQDVNPHLLIPKPRGRCVLLPLWSTRCGSSSGCTDLTAARAGLVPSSSSWHTHEGQAQTDKRPTATSQPTQLPHHLRPRGLESTSGAEDRMGAICY